MKKAINISTIKSEDVDVLMDAINKFRTAATETVNTYPDISFTVELNIDDLVGTITFYKEDYIYQN